MDIEKLYQGKGGYVFVSHSHLDIQEVRKIRNFLEKEGMEPILFYLRCMDGGDEEKLASLKKLIFDEIDAREFFLYVGSKNAQASKWVQEELDYIRKTRPQRLVAIDLSETENFTTEKLARLVRGMRVFISSSARDRELVERVTNALKASDFRVYDTSSSLSPAFSWEASLSQNFTELSKEGCVIALLTENGVRSQFLKYELQSAVEKNVPILPVVFGEMPITFIMEEVPALRRIQCLVLSENPTDEEISSIAQCAMKMQERLFNK